MSRKPGQPKSGGGTRAGVPNKISAALKDMVLQALDKAGGVAYLARQAEKQPAAFLALVGKVLPLQITGDGGGPVYIVTGVPRVDEKPHELQAIDTGVPRTTEGTYGPN